MKRFVFAGGLVLALGIGLGAQTLLTRIAWDGPDTEIRLPCQTLLTAPTMWDFEGTPYMIFTCSDSRVYVRELPVMRPVPPPPPPTHNTCTHIPGFVPGIHGGCVPANHPLARR